MQKFVSRCLEKADEHNFAALAFPALGTGNLKFQSNFVANIIKETVEKYCNDNPNTTIRKIVFVIYHKDEMTYKV